MIPDSYFNSFNTTKYNSRNPIQRFLIRRFMSRAIEMFDATAPSNSVLELGCGEGFVSGQLSERQRDCVYVGVDSNGDDLARLQAKFPLVQAHHGTVYDLSSFGQIFDVVVCMEVLEHLTNPGAALQQIAGVRPKWVILSVPHEPWFCLTNLARGKNITRFGNDEDHVNHWGPRGFRKLISQYLIVDRHEKSYPWQLVLARPK